jgi:hypothetical protein
MNEVTEENKIIVSDMLKRLSEIREDVSWRVNNSYTEDLDKTVLEILIFEANQQTARIAYRLEDGNVINYWYKSLEKRIPVHIVDLMLDILSFEMN